MAGTARFVGTLLALASVVLIALSLSPLTSERWYVLDITFSNAQTVFVAVNALRQCTTTSKDSCKFMWTDASSGDANLGTCTKSWSAFYARMYSSLACTLLSAVLSLAGVAASAVAAGAAAGILLVASLAQVASLTVFWWTLEKWFYCDKSACAFYGTFASTCDSGLKTPFWLGAGAAIATFVACLVCAASAADPAPADASNTESNAQPVTGDEAASPAPASTEREVSKTEPVADEEKARSDAPQEEPQKQVASEDVAEAEEAAEDDGGWVWDEESGMYWSESAYLYLHMDSGMYYDPQSGYWYDPESEQWFDPNEGAE